MGIYLKLAEARVKLQGCEMKKSGKNKHLGFEYSELQDFLPHINKINDELKMVSLFTFDGDKAQLIVVDSEKEESTFTFESSTAEAKLQGKDPNPIQELGSMHTYMRRYMYMIAYEIAIEDGVDKNTGKPTTPTEWTKESIIDFGKNKGKTLEIIYKEDYSYITYLADKSTDEALKAYCAKLVEHKNKTV